MSSSYSSSQSRACSWCSYRTTSKSVRHSISTTNHETWDSTVNDYVGVTDANAIRTPVWMVKKVDVPEPSTLAIFALGLMGLASRRFKKQA